MLTGGNGDTIRTDNTWTWDGTNWTLLAPATRMPAFVGAGSAFGVGIANCGYQAIALKTPWDGPMSAIAILQRLSPSASML